MRCARGMHEEKTERRDVPGNALEEDRREEMCQVMHVRKRTKRRNKKERSVKMSS